MENQQVIPVAITCDHVRSEVVVQQSLRQRKVGSALSKAVSNGHACAVTTTPARKPRQRRMVAQCLRVWTELHTAPRHNEFLGVRRRMFESTCLGDGYSVQVKPSRETRMMAGRGPVRGPVRDRDRVRVPRQARVVQLWPQSSDLRRFRRQETSWEPLSLTRKTVVELKTDRDPFDRT